MHARHRLVFLSIALFTVLAGPWARAADPWPTKPIRIIVPYTPGGLVDVLARLIGAKISPTLGQPVVVENKPGASTAIGAEFVAKSAPDGHTLLLATTTTLSTNPLMFKRLSYKTSEFTPVALLAMVTFIAVSNPGAPFSNVKELMDYAKVNPGKITFSTSGVGTASHLIGELFAAATGTKLTDIPYKGTNPAMMAVLSGEVTMAFDSAGLYTAPVQSGR